MRTIVRILALVPLLALVGAGCVSDSAHSVRQARGGRVRLTVGLNETVIETKYLRPGDAVDIICALMRSGMVMIPLTIDFDSDADREAATELVKLFDAPLPAERPHEVKTDAQLLEQMLWGLSLGANFRYGDGRTTISAPVEVDLSDADGESGAELEVAFRAHTGPRKFRAYAGLLAAHAYARGGDEEKAEKLYRGVLCFIGDDASLERQKEIAEDRLAYANHVAKRRRR